MKTAAYVLLLACTLLVGCSHPTALDKTLQEAYRTMDADSADIPSRYTAAITEREIGKELISHNATWKSSRDHFDWILRHDSLYSDVLWQYALLERYRGNRDHALDLARAQVRKKPGVAKTQLGLYKLYRYYMATTDSGDYLGWLRTCPGELPRLFAGETLRRNKDFPGAESLFTSIRNESAEISPQAVSIAFARLRFSKGDMEGGASEYWRGIEGMKSELGAEVLFEDLKYILSDSELDEYLSLDSLGAKKGFFRTFWNFRDPSLALKSNLRLQEHLRRTVVAESLYEYYGFRTRFNNPDLLHELKMPKAALLNEEYNDMGLMYLRHGEPDDLVRVTSSSTFDLSDEAIGSPLGPQRRMAPAVHSRQDMKNLEMEQFRKLMEGARYYSTQQDPSQAWLYWQTNDRPRMIFVFQQHNSSGNNWRLSPGPSAEPLIEELMLWNVSYSRLFLEREEQATSVEQKLVESTKSDVAHALSTENQTWENKTETFQVPHAIDMFRAPDGRSLLDISYAFPVGKLARSLPDSVDAMSVEIGFSLVDSRSREKTIHLDTMFLDVPKSRTGTVFNLTRYTVRPDSYAVSMHLRPLHADMLGIWKHLLQVTDFSRPGLMASSIQFLRPSEDQGAVVIEGMKVMQTPLRAHRGTDPLYVYFQVYHLVPDADGITSYRTECFLIPRGERDPAKGKQIHRVEKTGKEEMAAEFYALDVKSVPPGAYTLIIRITDGKSLLFTTVERGVDILTP